MLFPRNNQRDIEYRQKKSKDKETEKNAAVPYETPPFVLFIYFI